MATFTEQMRKAPYISIVIPVLNMAKELGHCLRSILCQKSEDIEILVVDDGSTDRTGDIVKEFSAEESRIRYFHQENAGVSSARNIGIDAAQGKYILFIDADDEIESDYLHRIAIQAKNSDADLLIWGIKHCHADGRVEVWNPGIDGMHDRTGFLTAFPSEQYGRHKGLYGFVSNKLIKKSILDRFGLRFDTTMTLMEDYDFFLGCYARCESFLCFSETGYRYSIHDGFGHPVRHKDVSYPQLIMVQVKCADLLEAEQALTPKNSRILNEAICGLSLAGFLETKRHPVAAVKSQLSFLWDTPRCIPAIRTTETRWKTLKWLILRKSAAGILVYVIIWRTFLYLRTGGKA